MYIFYSTRSLWVSGRLDVGLVGVGLTLDVKFGFSALDLELV